MKRRSSYLFELRKVNKTQERARATINEILKKFAEEKRIAKRSYLMIHPASNTSMAWVSVCITALVYIAASVPFILAFGPTLPKSYWAVELTIDTIYVLDIIMSFRMGLIEDENRPDDVILDPVVVSVDWLECVDDVRKSTDTLRSQKTPTLADLPLPS